MNTTRLTTTNGVTFITKSNDFFVSKSLEVYGEWSFGEIKLLSQILTKSDNIVEAGANIGAHTVFLAKVVRGDYNKPTAPYGTYAPTRYYTV